MHSKKFNIGFISGFIDSEVCVNDKKSYIMIANTNKDILYECQNFFKIYYDKFEHKQEKIWN